MCGIGRLGTSRESQWQGVSGQHAVNGGTEALSSNLARSQIFLLQPNG